MKELGMQIPAAESPFSENKIIFKNELFVTNEKIPFS